jgi:hypothetical protein
VSSIEERLAALEAEVQEMKFLLPARVDAFASAVNRLHEDLLAFRSESRQEFGDIKQSLLTILDRLPGADQ